MRTLLACVGLIMAIGLATPAVAGGQVDLNKASAEKLQGLNGIGDVLATRIVEYRKANDGFESVAQLEEVKGIGSATLADLEGKLVVGD